MAARVDPIRNFRFQLEIDNVTRAGFSEVAIAETTIEAVEYREGNDPPHVRKLSGLSKFGNITLKGGMTTGANSLELFRWHNDVSRGLSANDAATSRSACSTKAAKTKWPASSSPIAGRSNTTPPTSTAKAMKC